MKVLLGNEWDFILIVLYLYCNYKWMILEIKVWEKRKSFHYYTNHVFHADPSSSEYKLITNYYHFVVIGY